MSRVALAGWPLATGAALLVYVATGVSMAVATGVLAVGGALLWAGVVASMNGSERWALAATVRRGLRAGVMATLAYDAVRFGLVGLLDWSVTPFAAIPRFGHALLGPGAGHPAVTIAGLGFHLANGLGFAVAYSVFVSRPGFASGIAWALVLEAAMLLVYPALLDAVLPGEFLPMSLGGHLAYGATLGFVASRVGVERPTRSETAASA